MKRFITVSAILLAITGQAYAGNVESFGIGARATAMGGHFLQLPMILLPHITIRLV